MKFRSLQKSREQSADVSCANGGRAEIIPLEWSPKAVHRFLQVSYGIYQNDPLWVAPLLSDLKKVLGQANPFFNHAQMQMWVARQDGRDVGRIAGIIDHVHNEYHRDRAGFFGFFECVNDPRISHQLFAVLFNWARQNYLKRLAGPMNPSTNDECGLLIEGFDSPPVFMMTYNPPYYQQLVSAEGFVKAKDLLAFHFNLEHSPFERLDRIARGFARRQHNLTVRMVRRQQLDQELSKMREVYNAAWAQNWGFVPLSEAGINHLAKRLVPLFREGLVWLAETPDETVAFMLAVPDLNQAIQPLKGRLLSPGLVKFAPYLFGWKDFTRARVVTLGIKKKYRGLGIESVILHEALKCGVKMGLQEGEASWILEDNYPVQRVIELFGGKAYKTYRIYERTMD